MGSAKPNCSRGGPADLRGAEGERPGLGRERVGVVAVPPARLVARPAGVVPPAEERLRLRFDADLEHELGGSGDELAEGGWPANPAWGLCVRACCIWTLGRILFMA